MAFVAMTVLSTRQSIAGQMLFIYDLFCTVQARSIGHLRATFDTPKYAELALSLFHFSVPGFVYLCMLYFPVGRLNVSLERNGLKLPYCRLWFQTFAPECPTL